MLPAGGYTGPAPELPGGHDYNARTLEWYATWRHSPQAATFLNTDWQRLHMLAALVEEYWAEPRKDLLAEIRLNEAALGATAADRARLRWSLGEPEVGTGAKSTPTQVRAAKSRAERLLKAVGDAATEG